MTEDKNEDKLSDEAILEMYAALSVPPMKLTHNIGHITTETNQAEKECDCNCECCCDCRIYQILLLGDLNG